MGSTSLPRADIIVEEAQKFASGGSIIAVLTPCKEEFANSDAILVMSGDAAVDAVGYSDGASYAAMHCSETGQPVLMVPMPIETKGASGDITKVGTGTSALVVTDDPTDGVMSAVDAVLEVVEGGTVETPGIVLRLSLDGGISFKTIRLNSATTYEVPFIGVKLQFGTGTMVAGDRYTWTSTAPMWDATGLASARAKLAKGQILVRTWLVIGGVDPITAGLIATEAHAYDTENERFIFARCDIAADKTLPSWPATAAEQSALFAGVNSWRLSIGLGRRRKLCPLTRWLWRRPVSWAASLREYQRNMDLHNTTWWRNMPPLAGWITAQGDDEYDERVAGGALAGRFTTFATLSNGPVGAFIAKDLTRGDEDSLFLLPNNVEVTNEACTVANAATVRALGQSLILTKEGTASPESIADIQADVNSALRRALMAEHVPGRGPRVSSVRWVMSSIDDLRGPAAVVNGLLELNLRGTISQIKTRVMVA